MNSAKLIASLLASWAVAMAALVAFGGIPVDVVAADNRAVRFCRLAA